MPDTKKKPETKVEPKVEPKATEPDEVTTDDEVVTDTTNVEIEELPGGGTRETVRKSRRYNN